jgi:hypothetical protein
MSISDENLQEFIAIWREEYDEILTLAEAREYAQRMLDFYMLIHRSLPSEQQAMVPRPDEPSVDTAQEAP